MTFLTIICIAAILTGIAASIHSYNRLKHKPINPFSNSLDNLFVDIETAQLAKKAKFQDGCFGYYESQSKMLVVNFQNTPTEKQLSDINFKKRPGMFVTNNSNGILPQWAIAAPTTTQLKEWLFINHGLHVESILSSGKFDCRITKNKAIPGTGIPVTSVEYIKNNFDTSIGAEKHALKFALKNLI